MKRQTLERKNMNLRVPVPLVERLEELRERDYASLSAVAIKALAYGIAELEKHPSIYEGEQAR